MDGTDSSWSEFLERWRCRSDGALLRLAGRKQADLDVPPFLQPHVRVHV